MYLYEAVEIMNNEPFLQFFNTNTKIFYHSPIKDVILCTENAVCKRPDYFRIKDFPDDGWIQLDNIKGK